jgi:Domain of unknown function (DUF4396)
MALGLAALSAVAIAYDILVAGNHQPMWIMDVVWPVTALYLGPIAIWAYWRWGRPRSDRWQALHGDRDELSEVASVAVGVSHCGAGCTIGDIFATWLVFALGLELFGLALPVEYGFDFTFAFVLGIGFQYFAIAPMRGIGLREGLPAALKADALSLTAFEIGLFGWMAIMQLVLFTDPHLHPDHAAYWFLMQIGMALGFLTAYPVNVWLIRRGTKERM